MSHIILNADFEDVKRLFAGEMLEGEGGGVVLVEAFGFVLPVVVAPSPGGVIVRVENGDGHLDQDMVQMVIASVASRIAEALAAKPVRATLSRRILRHYGLLDA